MWAKLKSKLINISKNIFVSPAQEFDHSLVLQNFLKKLNDLINSLPRIKE